MADGETSAGKQYRAYIVFITFCLYAANLMDRQILSILMPSIKRDLLLSDFQLGAISGLAFGLFYAIVGLPIGQLADRFSRRNVMLGCLTMWSVLTAACGAAQSFWHLFACRVGVGVGEAGCTPTAHSLVSGYFPASARASVLSVALLGTSAGTLLALFGGGWIDDHYGWRYAFAAAALLGLLLALVIWLTVKEPKREIVQAENFSIVAGLKALWAKKSGRHLLIGASLLAFISYSTQGWLPSVVLRKFDVSAATTGLGVGGVLAIAGAAGTLLGGVLCDLWGRRYRGAHLLLPGLAGLAMLPFYVAMIFADSLAETLWLLAVPGFCIMFWIAPAAATIQNLAPPRMRGLAAAILLLFLSVIGYGIAPMAVGFVSDVLTERHQELALGNALLVNVPVALWAMTHLAIGAKYLGSDLDEAAASTAVSTASAQ